MSNFDMSESDKKKQLESIMIKPIKINANEFICIRPGKYKLDKILTKRLHECCVCKNTVCKCRHPEWAYMYEFRGNQHTRQTLLIR